MPGKLSGRIAVASLCALVLAPAAAAKTYEVTRRGDPSPGKCKPNDCSLREAVRAANKRAGKDRIVLPSRKRYVLRQKNPGGVGDNDAQNGDLDVLDRLRILHRGKGRATVDANGIDRIFHVGLSTLGVRKVKLTGGADPSGSNGDGGAILAVDASVEVVRSAIVGNEAGGSFGSGGAIDIASGDGELKIRSSKLVRNTAKQPGGAIDVDASAAVAITRSRLVHNTTTTAGGAISLNPGGGLKLVRSTVARNRAELGEGGGIYASNLGDEVVVRRSTLHHNRAGAEGGAIFGLADVRATNSTFARNTSGEEGGGIYFTDEVRLNAVTIARNRADADGFGSGAEGGGVFIDQAVVDVHNTLFARNRSGPSGGDVANDCATAVSAGGQRGHNLLSTTGPGNACLVLTAEPNSIYNVNPRVAKLRDNGGPTRTVGLRKGSPAINEAKRSGPNDAPNRDQRGRKRGKRPDIGAYERR